MSIEMPQTMAEWEEYISQFHGTVLLDKCRAANKMTFIQALLDEGLPMGGINDLFVLFVRRIAGLGLPVPTDGMIDLTEIARTDPVAQMGEVLEIKHPNPGGSGMDEIELMFQELDSQTDDFMEAEE